MHLRSPEEGRLVAEAFRRKGWRVVDAAPEAAAELGVCDVVFTDDVEACPALVAALHPLEDVDIVRPGEAMLTVLADPSDASILAAWQSGADYVVARPFDSDDPMKLDITAFYT